MVYLDGNYETKESFLKVFCSTHQVKHHTTFTNYRRSKTGMPCCGKAQLSKKLLKRQYTPETLEKMKSGALNRVKQYWSRLATFNRGKRMGKASERKLE